MSDESLAELDRLLGEIDLQISARADKTSKMMEGGSTKYVSVAETRFNRPSTSGVGGVIVPMATKGGVPMGVDPHVVRGHRCNVLDIAEQRNLSYNPDFISKEENDHIYESVRDTCMSKGITDPADIGFAVKIALARVANERERTGELPQYGYVPVSKKEKQAQAKSSMKSNGQAAASKPASVMPIGRGSLMSAFSQPVATVATEQGTQATLRPETPLTILLVDMPPAGEFKVACHSVTLSNDGKLLSLIYDPRTLATEWVPPAGYKEPFAVRINGEGPIYLVLSTGLRSQVDDKVVHMLLVESMRG